MFHDGSRISANRLILDATVARLESKIESRISHFSSLCAQKNVLNVSGCSSHY
jgi:hypothetical protein